MSQCTFKDCDKEAVRQHTTDGCINLCQDHSNAYAHAVKEFYAKTDDDATKRLVAVWIKAQGGVQGAFARIKDRIPG